MPLKSLLTKKFIVMKKLSFKNLSLLGLVLMGASALTAAIVPAKKDKQVGQGNNNGRLLAFSASAGPQNVVSCVIATGTPSCTVTDASFVASTTGRGLADSYVGLNNNMQTIGNTSQTAAEPEDQQSVVVVVLP